jgi:hypothetical protein
MTVKSGQVWSGLVVTKGATGALAAPSAGPAGVLYVDGVSNAASVTISGSNPYKWTVTLPTLTAGQCVSMYITATIATIATASVVAEDVADTVILSDVPAVNVTQHGGVAVAAANVDGTINADLRAWNGVSGTILVSLPAMIDEGFGTYNWNEYSLHKVRDILGLATANLDTQLAALPTDQDVADALLLAPSAGAPAAGSAMAYLAAIDNSGTYSYSNTVDDGSGNLLDGVYIQLATDSGFTNVVTITHSNASGAFTVRSDQAGTHYLRLQLAGYSFTDQTVTLA